MKPTAILALFLAFLAAIPAPGQEQSQETTGTEKTYNQTPAPCCKCFRMYVEGVSDDSEHPDDGHLWPSINGEYRADVTIVYLPEPPPNTVCDEYVSVKVTGRVMSGGIQVHEEVKSITVSETETEKTLAFVLPADLARLGGEWEFSSYCPGDEESEEGENEGTVQINDSKPGCEPITIKLGSGCKSCASGSCQLSGGGEMDEEGNCNISASSEEGGMSGGDLNFRPDGFSNPGTSALSANVSPGITVNRGPNGHITSVQTGTTLIEVKPAAADILAEDPNAFTVTHTATGQQEPFRTTTISFVTDNGAPRLRMDSKFDHATTRHELTNPSEPAFPSFNQVGTTFKLSKGRVTGDSFVPLSCLVYVKNEPSPGKSVQRRRMTERASASAAWFTSSDTETTYEKQVRGWVKTREIIDPTGAALTSTWVYYQPGEITGPGGGTEGLGRLKHEVRYDGYETFHTYALHTHSVTSPFAGNPAGTTTTSTWNPVAKSQTVTTTLEAGGNSIVSKTVTAHTPTTTTQTVHTSAGQTLVTTTTHKTSGQDFGGRPASILHPDGTRTVYSYTRNPDRGYTTQIDKLSAINGNSAAKGIRTITTTDARGNTISRSTVAIGDADGTVMESMTVTAADPLLGRPTETLWLPAGVTTETTYSCCGVSSEKDMYGITTRYAYDGLQRLVKTNRLGVTTATVRESRQDVFNRFEPTDWQVKGTFTKTYRYTETVQEDLSPDLQMDNANLVAYSESNLAGTLMASGSPDPTTDEPGAMITTTTAVTYKPAAQGIPADFGFYLAAYATGPEISQRTVTTTPDGFSQTEARLLDGRTAITSGKLAPTILYGYSANETGEVTTRSYMDTSVGQIPDRKRETVTTQSDWAGRTTRVTYMGGAFATMHYNSKGQMVRSVDPDGVVTLHAYNAKGEQTVTATDLIPDANYDDEADNIAYGTDTVQSSETVPAIGTIGAYTGAVWKTVSKVWQDGHLDPAAGTIVSTSMRSPGGLRSSSQSIGVDNASTSLTTLSGGGNWTTTQTSPDNTYTVATFVDGRMDISRNFAFGGALISSTSMRDSSNTPLSGYDDWNRPTHRRDSRTGVSSTAYLSSTADVVKSVTDPGSRTTNFLYDIRGRQITVDAPDSVDADNNPLLNVTNTAYNPDGTVQEASGAQTYRTTHTYDYAQRQVSLTTYGTATATTTWKYSPDRGFLTEKNHPGETGNGPGNAADSSYTAAGRLLTRTWERGVTTTYGYDGGGRQTSTGYSDSTPGVSITYDALNRPEEVTRGTSTWGYAYDPNTLRLLTETHPLGGTTTERLLTRSYDNLGRPDGFTLGTLAAPAFDHSVGYGFDDAGRHGTVTGAGRSFQYTYTANSGHLIGTIAGPEHTVTNTWKTDRNDLHIKKNEVASPPVSQYTYDVNEIGQRVAVETTGTAFGNTDRGWAWGYDSLGQATKAVNTADTALNRAFVFDGIGNRTSATDGSGGTATTVGYTPNALNQYEAINPGTAVNPTFDADGNLQTDVGINALTYGLKYEWDGENRLIAVRKADDTLIATYAYDHLSRRIRKSTTAAAYSVGATDTAYLYEGWNVVAEYSITNNQWSITQAYTWGIDLSGSMQGAGGVGGLLSIHRGPGTDGNGDRTWTDTFYTTYDGNGNVSEYLDKNGAEAAHFEYDPFGRLAASTGTPADFTYRFSTKPQDFETGLYYYGYRYYDPVTGRWPSRDPIGENGGVNLYGFVANDGMNRWDKLGREIGAYEASKRNDFDDALTRSRYKWSWSPNIRVSPYDSCVVLVDATNSAQIILTGKNQRDHDENHSREDEFGMSSEEHERMHEWWTKLNWDIMRSELNPEDKSRHKDKSCARIWQAYLAQRFYYHYETAKANNAGHDEAAYPEAHKQIPRLDKEAHERQAKEHLDKSSELYVQYYTHCKS